MTLSQGPAQEGRSAAVDPASEHLSLRVRSDDGEVSHHRIDESSAVVGSGPGAELRLDAASVAPRHGRLERTADGWHFRDGGDGRTTLNGHALGPESSVLLREGDHLQLGDVVATVLEVHGHGRLNGSSDAGGKRPLRVGRAVDNDLVVDDPEVASYHLEAWLTSDGLVLRDVGNHGRTVVDGIRHQQGPVGWDAIVNVGGTAIAAATMLTRLRAGRERAQASLPGAALLVGRALHRVVGQKRHTILDGIDICVRERQMVAIAGCSGAGKSSLMRVLNGYDEATAGSLAMMPSADGTPIFGYVPQDDILHREMPLRQAIVLSAMLRFPPGTPRATVDARADELLVQLGLIECAHVRVSHLSGGQRKRAAVALELMTRPRLLLLDEPTSGLDPASDHHLMTMLRRLADSGYGVLIVTHTMTNISSCDALAVIADGGRLVYWGQPEAALAHFAVESIELVYDRLEEPGAGTEWRARFVGSPHFADLQRDVELAEREITAHPPATTSTHHRAAVQRWQLVALARRYVRSLLGDTRNLLFLYGQVPVILVLAAVLFPRDILDRAVAGSPLAGPDGGTPSADAVTSVQLLFVIGATIVWLGTINAAREISKEGAIWERERHLGVRPSSYLLSKVAVLGGLSAIQMVLLTAVAACLWTLPGGAPAWLGFLAVAMLTGFAGIAMGLTISALVATADRAVTLIPVAMIPQLLFGGVNVPYTSLGGPGQRLSSLMAAHWSFQGLARVSDRAAHIPAAAADDFAVAGSLVQPVAGLSLLTLGLLAIAAVSLRLRHRFVR